MNEQKQIDMAAVRAYHRERDARRWARREEQREQCFEQVQACVRRLAPAFPAIQSVYVFGSLCQAGRFRQDSDVDLALCCDRIDVESAFGRVLERALQRPVDLRPLEGAILEAVAESGEKIYERAHAHSGEEHSA